MSDKFEVLGDVVPSSNIKPTDATQSANKANTDGKSNRAPEASDAEIANSPPPTPREG